MVKLHEFVWLTVLKFIRKQAILSMNKLCNRVQFIRITIDFLKNYCAIKDVMTDNMSRKVKIFSLLELGQWVFPSKAI